LSAAVETAHELEAVADRLRHAIGAGDLPENEVVEVLRSVQRGLTSIGFAVLVLRDDVPASACEELEAVSRLIGASGSTIPAVVKLLRLGGRP
jgi:hypothetical protein